MAGGEFHISKSDCKLRYTNKTMKVIKIEYPSTGTEVFDHFEAKVNVECNQ